MKLAFYDSGLGGLSVLKVFLENLMKDYPAHLNLECFYIADTLRAPYGARSEEDLKSYVYDFAHFADNKEADFFISACNTSSNLFEDLDLSIYNFKSLNLFAAMQNFFNSDQAKKYIYLATEANIKSKKFLNWRENIIPIACPKIVPLIEEEKNEEAVNMILHEYLNRLELDRETKIILGCTHYALLENDLKKKLDTPLVNPAKALYDLFKLENIESFIESSLKKSNFKINAYSTSLNSPLTVAIKELTLSIEI
ncbi:MAG: aspartate/glutamate racemase family protein [Candidatus Caenarcaniphilales bacterium]|nr:aspartate/glutamate racemase family protein [Candidatus Caenarcaniphilales bacterium]